MKLNRSFLSRNNWAFILIFLFVGVVSYIPYKYAQEKTIVRNDKYLELQALTELKSKQVRQWQKERGSEVKFFSESQPFIQYAQEIAKGLKQNEDLLRNSLVKIMSDNRYENIFILNETGDILFSVLPGKSSIDSLTRIHAMEAFRSGKITVPELYYSKFQKKIQWEVFAPINENNKIIATVLFLIDPSDFFFPMIRDWPASTKTEEALLVRRDGQQFICITPLKKADNSKLQLSFPLDQKENILGSELYEGPDYSGDMVVANISKIPRSSWFLIVKEDSSEVYADFHKLFTLIVILIILFILFAIVLVSMVYHRKQKNLYKKLLHQSNTLHHTQEELGATLYSIGDGVITTNAEGYINHMNPAAESLTGWSELEAKGKWIGEIFQIVDENTGKKIENPLFHLLNEREKNPAVVYLTLLSRGKKEIYIRNSGALIKDKQGERLGTILFFSDQSESKLRQKLIELRLNFFEFSVRHTLQETLTYILDEIGKFTHSPLGFIHFVMDDQQTIESRAWSTQTQQEFCKIEKSGCHCDVRQAGIWADCIKTKKILVHNNYADVVNKKEYPQGHPFLTRELVVPVFRDQKIKALLGIGNKPTDYTDLDVEIVSFLADVSWELAEYKKRGELLQQSEERFERLFERAPLGYQSLDENGNIIEINEAWTETLGYNREEVIGKWFDNFLAPHEAEKFRRELPSFKQKDNVHIVFEMIKKDGQHRFLSIEARAGYKNDGSFEKTHCIMKDITEQKIIEERLRESEEKMGSIFQVAPTGIGVVKDRIILEVNPRFCEMTGYLKEELIGQNTRMLYQTEEEFERIRKEISDQLTLEGNGTMETTHKRKDGTPISVILSHTLLDSTDPSKGFTFNVLDITERKSAEIAIKEHERQLTSMVGNLPGFIYRCKNDESWTMLFISQMCFNITGYRPEELISNKRITFNDIIVKEYRSIVRDKWEAVISNNSFFELEYKIVRADNRIIWVLERGVGIYDDKGEILFLEGYIEDISQRKEAEETIRLLFDSTAEGIFGIDTKGNCTFCNNAALKMLGYSEEMEMVGQNVHELIHHHQQSGSGLSKEDCSIYKVFREGTMSTPITRCSGKKTRPISPLNTGLIQ